MQALGTHLFSDLRANFWYHIMHAKHCVHSILHIAITLNIAEKENLGVSHGCSLGKKKLDWNGHIWCVEAQISSWSVIWILKQPISLYLCFNITFELYYKYFYDCVFLTTLCLSICPKGTTQFHECFVGFFCASIHKYKQIRYTCEHVKLEANIKSFIPLQKNQNC